MDLICKELFMYSRSVMWAWMYYDMRTFDSRLNSKTQ